MLIYFSPLIDEIDLFRQAYLRANVLHPITTVAICILPDHLHAIWQLPADDGNYALRWRIIKSHFSRQFSANPQRSSSKIKRERYLATPLLGTPNKKRARFTAPCRLHSLQSSKT